MNKEKKITYIFKKKNIFLFCWNFVLKHKIMFFLLLITSILACLDEAVTPYLLDNVLKSIEQYQNNFSSYQEVKFNTVKMIVIWISFDILYRISGFISTYIYPVLEAEIRMYLFREIQFYRPKFFAKETIEGGLENSIADTADGVQEIIDFFVATLIPSTIGIIACVVQIIYRNKFLGKLVIVWIFFHLSTSVFLLKKSIKSSSELQNAQNQLATKLVDSFLNRNLTLQFNQQDLEYKYILETQKKEIVAHRNLLIFNEIIKLILSLVVIIVGIILFLHILFLLKKKLIKTSDLVFLYTTTFNIIRQVWQIGTQLGPFVEGLGQCSKGISILDEKMKLLNLEASKNFNPLNSDIEFRNVTLIEEGKKILDNISFIIKTGEKVAVLGKSGSGKTTLLKLILGLTNDYEGEVFIGNINIKTISGDLIRNYCGILDQKHYWFDRTIKENLLYGIHSNENLDEKIKELCKKLNLDSYIENLPEKINTKVSTNILSGGQVQRFCLIRLLLSNKKILMLDEISNGLDINVQKIIGHLLEEYTGTCLFTTHNLYYKKIFTKIIIMQNGKIINIGSHEDLKNKCEIYNNLIEDFS